MLLVVDNVPLRAAAWAELQAARKRLEKATRDLHRHEQVDEPGFRAWLGSTFPELISSIRDLVQQIAAKSRIVQAVEEESWFSGRSPRSIWWEWQRRSNEPAPETRNDEDSTGSDPGYSETGSERFPEDEPGIDWREGGPDRSAFEALFEGFCAMQGLDPNDPEAQAMRENVGRMLGMDTAVEAEDRPDGARDIYRRLVQHLHPDRGGEWTAQRARLWHQVQEAWAARDGDMLARLEAEWEMAADTLGPSSPLGRLRAALTEIDAARRDAERKVRRYRKAPEWRFSLAPFGAKRREELRQSLDHQREELRRELAGIETTIGGWERREPRRSPRRGSGRRNAKRAFAFGFEEDWP